MGRGIVCHQKLLTLKQKLIVIVGPTASGKSALAVLLARKFGGEIISADSRQIYKELDIGTGKVPGSWRGGSFLYKKIPHHCIDFVSPRRQYSAAQFQQCAQNAITDMRARGKLPIITGGTAFWIDAVVYGMELPDVPPDARERARLEKKSSTQLLAILTKLDPRRAAGIEKKNPRRLIRAIEIARALGRVPKLKKRAQYDTLWIGIAPPRETLEKKIRIRLASRIRTGMIQEGRGLRQKGMAWKRFYELGLEYGFLADLLRGKTTKKEMASGLQRAILKYAKRQMTWWRRNKEIRWIARPDTRAAEGMAQKFITGLR